MITCRVSKPAHWPRVGFFTRDVAVCVCVPGAGSIRSAVSESSGRDAMPTSPPAFAGVDGDDEDDGLGHRSSGMMSSLGGSRSLSQDAGPPEGCVVTIVAHIAMKVRPPFACVDVCIICDCVSMHPSCHLAATMTHCDFVCTFRVSSHHDTRASFALL